MSEINKHTDHPELSSSYGSSSNNNNVEHNYARIQRQGSDFSDKLAPVGHYRCIVELDVLIEGLRRCQFCQMQLSLIHSEGILHAGLGGWVHIRCPNCNFINKIPLCKQHQQPEKDTRGRSPFDINTKLATGKFYNPPPLPIFLFHTVSTLVTLHFTIDIFWLFITRCIFQPYGIHV